MRNHLFFLSTDKHASPFDINIGLDAGFDLVIPYSSVQKDDVEGLTHDIIFSRGPKGTKHSAIFVGGSDIELTKEIVKSASESMFEPFTVSIFSDPKGAYTTAAALVAKTENAAKGLNDKKVIIFGGTGPVGSIAAVLCAREKADVTIVTSRDLNAGLQAAEKISADFDVTVRGAAAQSDEERLALLVSSDIAISTVKAGVQILSLKELGKINEPKIIADVNAVPPSGFEGLDPNDDMKEITDNVKGIGALCIGYVKYKVEVEIFKTLLKKKTIIDFETAYELAKTMV